MCSGTRNCRALCIQGYAQWQNPCRGYVWNPATRQFYRVPEFENMQEVDIDSKTKTITSRIRTTTGICIDTYKWKNGKLNKISTKNI